MKLAWYGLVMLSCALGIYRATTGGKAILPEWVNGMCLGVMLMASLDEIQSRARAKLRKLGSGE